MSLDVSVALDGLEKLDSTFSALAEEVEAALANNEEAEKQREIDRKQLLRKEFSKALMYLGYQDKEIVKRVRTLNMEILLKVKQERAVIRKQIRNVYCDRVPNGDLTKAREELMGLVKELESVLANTKPEVGVDPGLFNDILQQAVYIKTRDCNPRQFRVVQSSFGAQSVSVVAQSPCSFSPELVKVGMEVVYSAVNSDNQQQFPVFKATLKDLLKAGVAVLKSEGCVDLQLPASPTGMGQLDVTLLGVLIKEGRRPVVSTSTTRSGDTSRSGGDLSRFLDETAIDPACRDLDYSDIRSLDMTSRRAMDTAEATETPGSEACAIPQPFGRLSTVPEVTEEDSRRMNVSSFSPLSDKCHLSTMRETSMKQLNKLLESLETLPSPDDDLEDSILAPSSGRQSVEEMQRSLSRENSPSSSILDLPPAESSYVAPAERSIRISTKTTIFQELSTPQVKMDNKRYDVLEGNTKVQDGVAGRVKRSRKNATERTPASKDSDISGAKQQKSIWDDEQAVQPSEQVAQPSEKVPQPSGEQAADSEAVTAKDVSPWDDDSADADETGPPPFWDAVDIDEEEEFSDKAYDVLSMSRMDKSLNGSVWNVVPEDDSFNFITCHLNPVETLAKISRNSSFEGPAFMAWMQKHKVILVSEPHKNRIGIHDQDNLTLMGIFPDTQHTFNNPLHLLHLQDDGVVVIHKGLLEVFRMVRGRFTVDQKLTGCYKGLAEGEEGELITLQEMGANFRIKIMTKNGAGKFEEGDSIDLTLTEHKGQDWRPKPRNIVYVKGKIYITDMGSARIYIVDRKTGEQSCEGYYGTAKGHFVGPLGIIQDDAGNLLVADNKLARISVFDPKGRFVKEVLFQTNLTHPMGFLRMGNQVLLCYMGEDEKNQGIVRFNLEYSHERSGSPIL